MGLKIQRAQSSAEIDQVRRLYRGYSDWQTQTYHDVLFLMEDFYSAIETDGASLPGKYAPPAGCLLLALVDGEAAGTGAFLDYGNDTCEMKRMYVDPRYQNHGIGRALVGKLVDEARNSGYSRMILETGPRQLAAQKLYAALGFKVIEPFSDLGVPDEVMAQLPEDLQRGIVYMELWL